jgi:ATP-dependent DNA helicase RecG
MLTLADLERMLSEPEGEGLEFKSASTQMDLTQALRYCVALGNEGGGWLVLGVSDVRPRAVVGTAAFRDLNDFKAKAADRLGFRVDAIEISSPQGRVVAIFAPGRPSGQAFSLDGTFWMRIGEQLRPMTDDRLRAIHAEVREPFERRDATPALPPHEALGLLDVQAYFDLLKVPQPQSQESAAEKLEQDRILRRVAGGTIVTQLGALSFAKDLRRFPDLARKAARVTVYSGIDKLSPSRDQTGHRGYAIGFAGLVDFINQQLPANEVIGDALRREVHVYPEPVIRELVANALIHQDLEVTGASVHIEIYSDRIEIANPGRPVISADRFIDGYRSRNEQLADLMRRIGICEERGSGVDRVISLVEAFQLPAPDFRVREERTVVTLYAPRPLKDMARDDRVRACYQHCCLRHVTHQWTNNESLRARFKLPESRAEVASRIIADTVDAQLIKPADPRSRSKKFSRYVPFWA